MRFLKVDLAIPGEKCKREIRKGEWGKGGSANGKGERAEGNLKK